MLCAQDLTSGAVGGVTVDASGAAVRGSSVTLEDAATHRTREIQSDAQGEFLLTTLVPGMYRLRATHDGFAAESVKSLTVALGQTARFELRLRAAALAQTVVVTVDDAALPSLADSPVNATLSPQELMALPIDGRRYQSFALLTPLVNLADTPSDTEVDAIDMSADPATGDATNAAVTSDTIRLSIRGLDPSQNSNAQDGGSAVRAYDGEPRGGALVPFTIPLEAVQEFQVRVTGAGTSLGRDIGGSVNAITRRGEDTLHGSAFFLLRNSGVGAANPFAIATRYNNGNPTSTFVKPRDQREQFGGSFGRALPHTGQRLFLFVAGEGQRRSFPGIASPDNPNFFRLTPKQRALLGNRGVSGANISKALNFLDSLGGEVPRQSNEIALFPRLDFQRGARSSVSLTYTRVRFDSPAGVRNETVVPRARDSFGTLATHTDSLDARWSQALSSRWLNEVKLAVSRDGNFIQEPPPLPQEPQTAPGGTVPQVTIDLGNSSTGGSFVFGTPASLARRRLPDERRAEVYETVTFTGRAHTLTLGAGGSLLDTTIETGVVRNGAYRFASGAVNGRAGGLVDFITDSTFSATAYPNGGCPSIFSAVHLFCFSSYTQSYGASTSVRFHTGEGAAFVREAWRLTPHLRVDAGARYEYFRMPLPQHPNATLDAVFGATAATNFLPGDPGNLAPHLGIAYGIGERTVVRLGYGIHFGRITGRVLQQLLQNTALPASRYSIHLTPRTEVDPHCASAGTNFGYPATDACVPTGILALNSNASLLARHFQLPMMQDAEITVEHGFRHGLTLSATYALALERELPNTIDLNIAPSHSRAAFRIARTDNAGPPGARNGDIFNVPLYTARLSPLFGPVTGVLSNGTGTSHHGVVQFTRAAPRGVTLRLAYTFSKAIDNVRHTGSSVDANSQFDPFDISFDKAASNFDRQQKLTATVVWSPVFANGSDTLAGHWTRATVNGWSFAPIVFATTGRPYSYLVNGGTFLPGGRTTINGSGGATYLPTVGRNTLRLPWTENVDLRLLRGVTVHGVLTRFSAEAFNLANHRNLTAVQQRAFLVGSTVNGITSIAYQDAATIAAEGLTTQPFGTPTSSATILTSERRLQFGARFSW